MSSLVYTFGLILGILLINGNVVSGRNCYSCEGDACETPDELTCGASSDGNEQCFMLFDDTASVIRMGCRSALDAAEFRDLIKYLLLCNTDNCNGFDSIPTPNTCSVCNSSLDVSCATNPSVIESTVQCQTIPHTQCFSIITGDGHTSRGCLQTLESDNLIDCLDTDKTLCQTCTGTSCNNKLFPETRLSCHRCSSADDADCESLPNASELCPLHMEGDACVTRITNGITTRGCRSELPCGTANRKSCLPCSGDNCNTIDLIATSIGDPGAWQGLPLNCYTCEGDQCATELGVISMCTGNNLQTCATVFDSSGVVVSRGCSDSVARAYDDYCDTNPDNCFECKSNECNIATSKSDYVDCIFCDAKTNPDCLLNVAEISRTRKCFKTCMTALYPRTSDPDPSYELSRSCLDDKDLDDRESCGDDPLCRSCTEASCNTHLVPEVRTTCYHCSGDSCQLPTVKTCASYTDREQCYILFNEEGSITELGCKSDYDPMEIRSFLTSKRLFLCDGDNCNEFDNLPTTTSCRLCNSRTDKLCAVDPTNVASTTSCSKTPVTDCYIRVLDDGHTERGCLSSLDDQEFLDCYHRNSSLCTICAENNCNDEVFPANRLSCHTCNSADDASCDKNPLHSNVCLKYSPDQNCVTTIIDDITHRGCSSEITCDTTNIVECRTCSSSDCNVVNIKRLHDANPGVWQDLPLNCYYCSGDGCAVQWPPINVCSSNIQQHCVTVFDEDNTVIRRGCSDPVEAEYSSYCDENSNKCFNCNSNGCNVADSLDAYVECVYCDSRTNPNCVTDVSLVSGTRLCRESCMAALILKSENETSYGLLRSCLDDKDLDDRNACGVEGSLCIKCNSDNCNVNDPVEDRLECYSCLGDECESPVAQKCVSYLENDACFILFDDDNSIERMGCKSELEQAELESSFDYLLTCDGNNCNHFSIIPQPKSCYLCNSLNDVRCATSPSEIGTVSTCSSLPHVDCYTRVQSDGQTARGCVSALTKTQRKGCFSEDETDCTTCNGDNCNLEIFPEDRRRCHLCDSLTDPTCQDSPDASVVCPIYSTNEICSSKIINDVTYRGCGNDFICDDSDKQYCKLCNTTNCNRANLYQNAIGYPGLWQDPPINCYTCFRDECDEANVPIQACVNNRQQNCVTVFSMAGKVVQRGCSDIIYSGFYDHHCDNHPDLCTYCKSSGCNNADSLDEYVDCVFCDSATNSNCTVEVNSVTRTRKCLKQCMTALYPQSDDDEPSYGLVRSCLDDKDLDDRDECRSGSSDYCKVCEGDSCNVDQIPEDRLSCLRCTGEECEEPQETVCPSYKDNDRCFILFDDTNSVAQMGCRSDLTAATVIAQFKKLLFCDGPNCNDYSIIPTPRNCLVCDSANDASCATRPNSLISMKQCSDFPYTSCYTRIEDGLTKRGCLSDVEVDTLTECIESGDDVKCNVCDSNSCNIEVYPADRKQCFQCSSDDDTDCQGSPKEPGVCPIYQEDDQCVVTLSGDKTIRGCVSQLTCNTEDRGTCRICPDDNCNIVDLLSNYVGHPGRWQDLPLKCYECEGDDCKDSLGLLNTCSSNNLQNCATVFDNTGAVIKRGCSDAIATTHEEYCDTNAGNCQFCKSSECNKATSLDDYSDCVFCDSITNTDCVLNPEGAIRTRKCHEKCMVALYPRTSEDEPSYALTRSCLDDKDLDDREACSDDNEYCQACEGASCNKFALPETRHECLTCQGDDCEDAQAQQCLSYHPNDQCYILFDPSSNIIAMGCRSEFEQSSVTSLIQSKNLLLCDGKLCNTYDSIPNAQSCVACNSATDPRCATNPNLIVNSTICSALPYTGCVTRINSDGDTVRGCHSDLENTEFYNCLQGTDSVCSTCSGDQCNNAVYPSDRLKCHRCDSINDANCAESPASNAVCPKYAADDTCRVSYRDDVTYRGCSTELSCDESNKKICRVCEGAACNTHNLEQVAKDGEPGKWQDIPINCYTCEGDACSESLGGVQVCSNNNLQNCMTVFNGEGVVIQRGCSDPVTDAQETWCTQNPDKCYRCNSNGCNLATSLDDYVDCVLCDSRTNPSCVTDPTSLTRSRRCYQSCMTALYPRTTEDNPSYETTRTCLDDKDLDDRRTCQAGSEQLCSACDGDKCNTDEVPADRRSCYQCRGDGCQIPEAGSCVGYRPNDQCFIMFDEQHSVTELGCKSDLTEAQSIELIKAKRLFLCDDDNCNDFEAIPGSQSCALCNSLTDVNCAVNPTGVSSTTSCNIIPYTQCYSRVLSNGATERGCLSSLVEDEFYECLTGTSDSCSACTGASCNKQIFPEDRMSCHICDSASDPNCETAPDSLSVCVKYDPSDTCVASYTAGTTSRNCGTSLQCDASNRRKCRSCTTPGCNIFDLASKQDTNFGKWQNLPLTCYECVGDQCQSGTDESATCENNNEQDCTTVFDESGNVIRRGCSDAVEAEYDDYCDSNTGRCFNCKSNNCNTATALTDFQECVYCDSTTDATCVTDPSSTSFKSRQCQSGCMVALYQSDTSDNPAYELIRTCLNDKEASDQETCTAGGEPFCSSCPGESCNRGDLPEDRLRCHACLGDSCEEPVSQQCPQYREGDQCFIRFDTTNSVTEMGCLSAFGDQAVIDILKTKQVYICDGDNCNSLDQLPATQKCAVCDSSDDVNCAINPTFVGTVDTCTLLPYTNCYTKITSTGTTQRGCLVDLPADEFAQCILAGGEQCSQCVGDACNREIFPENRLRCYSCDSETDPDCEVLPAARTISACPYLRDSEKCVTALGGTVTERGCSSQLLCDITEPTSCRQCTNTGCNTLDLIHRVDDGNHGMWQNLPLRCHKCIGDHCKNSLGPASTCTSGDDQDCMTVFDEEGEVVRRGCLYEVEDDYDVYCRGRADRCLTCKSNECNDAWELSDYVDCVYCNSETDATCVTSPSNSGLATRKCQNCMAAAFPASNGTTQIIRTCLDDKEIQVQYVCKADETGKECASCSEEGCNTFNYPRDRLTCHVCEGSDCPGTANEHCAAYVTGDTCFAKYLNGNVQITGCASALDDSVIQQWKDENNFHSCDGDLCNAVANLPTSKTCFSCDSSSNVACATDPSSITTLLFCPAPVSSCYTNIITGVTHRGCLRYLNSGEQNNCQAEGSSTLCDVCSGERCNSAIYPSDRRRCYICNSESDDNCKAEPDSLSICPNYLANNLCVVKYEDGVTERGCSSDLTCDASDDKHCVLCSQDGCNVAQLDDGAHTIIASKVLLTLLFAAVSWIGLNNNWF